MSIRNMRRAGRALVGGLAICPMTGVAAVPTVPDVSPMPFQHQHTPPKPTPGQHPQGHEGHEMMHVGALGDYSMSQEGSGTTWLPASSPHYAKMLPKSGHFDMMLMGMASANFTDAGGPRGDSQLYSNSMVMLHGQSNEGRGKLGFRIMTSLDPVFNGKRGAPNLFQTGETADGAPLVDRQHPHDMIAELALVYSTPISDSAHVFVYGGPAGEPVLGNTMFLHRPSGFENPEAPITHHWFDSTHITYGVITAGVTVGDKLKLDASYFNGSEPDEDRYDIDEIKLNSGAGRITYNPNPDWSFSASYGFLKEPEALEPGVDQHRLTASAFYNKPMGGNNLALGLMFGRNIKDGGETDGWNLEASYGGAWGTAFARYENVVKDEIFGVPAGDYRIQKLTFGMVRNIGHRQGYECGIGAYVGLFQFPDSLEPFYGSSPVTLGAFIRMRPAKT